MFPYFGSKILRSKYYPAPIYGTIVEPFAGAAGYSLRYSNRNVILCDKNPDIRIIWNLIINNHERIDSELPETLEKGIDVRDLNVADDIKTLLYYCCQTNMHSRRFHVSAWGARDYNSWLRKGLVKRAPLAKRWTMLDCDDYRDCPDIEATWFIDPPYQQGGKHYTMSTVDYEELSKWILTRKGQIIVCENAPADWLPFSKLYEHKTKNNSKKVELIFYKESQ